MYVRSTSGLSLSLSPISGRRNKSAIKEWSCPDRQRPENEACTKLARPLLGNRADESERALGPVKCRSKIRTGGRRLGHEGFLLTGWRRPETEGTRRVRGTRAAGALDSSRITRVECPLASGSAGRLTTVTTVALDKHAAGRGPAFSPWCTYTYAECSRMDDE